MKKSGKKVAKPTGKAAKKAGVGGFKAPEDFKPHFLLVQISTEKDGLITSSVKATRFKGKFARDADDKKKSDLGTYDTPTLMGIASVFASVSFKTNSEKFFAVSPKEREAQKSSRLPPKCTFQILLRVGKSSKDNTITVGTKSVWQMVEKATGRMALKELEKTDPVTRILKKARRFLPVAFKSVQIPPKKNRKGSVSSDE